MEGSRQRSTASVVFERAIATILVSIWTVVAYRLFGFDTAGGVVLTLLMPLAFIWIPELLSRIAGEAAPDSLQPDFIVHPTLLRLVGWILITVIPGTLFVVSVEGIKKWYES